MSESIAMDTLVQGKTDSELLKIMVSALTSNENLLLNKLTNKSNYQDNLPDAEIIAAICRHVNTRITVSVAAKRPNSILDTYGSTETGTLDAATPMSVSED